MLISNYLSSDKNWEDEINWMLRFVQIISDTDSVIFEEEVEAPTFWSDRAVTIAASKYFKGRIGTPERETSVKQMINRVVNQISSSGKKFGYFNDEESEIFRKELALILVNQMASFNSPVWFNVGGVEENIQAAACFVLNVEDNMESILEWYRQEAMIFKQGSGSGVNISKLRSSKEYLSGGGRPSGPVSFMKAADSIGGVIKSAGRTRRSSKMVIMNDDHPDLIEFIECKQKEEKKAFDLHTLGYSNGIDGEIYNTIAFQNSNHAVRLTDSFMEAVEKKDNWYLLDRYTKEPIVETKADEIMDKIVDALYSCGDPGIQFHDTINKWNTVKDTHIISASNPCFRGDMLVDTSEGFISFEDLFTMQNKNRELPYAFSFDEVEKLPVLRKITKVYKTKKVKKLVRVLTDKGLELFCTPDHKFLLRNGEWKEAKDLPKKGDLNGSKNNEDKIKEIEEVVLDEPVWVYDITVEDTHNFGVSSKENIHSIIAANCSEFNFIDNSACNLASLKLTEFLQDDIFDIRKFRFVCHTIIIAQDILVDMGVYPTEEITKNSKDYRPLGLGYSDLGSLLMRIGYPYDSEQARQIASTITALLTGQAYTTSHALALKLGSFAKLEENENSFNNVLRLHSQYVDSLDSKLPILKKILPITKKIWGDLIKTLKQKPLFRNAQVSLAAPCGTISLLMDCDTTGIEPEFSLVKHKKLSGGGNFVMVNKSVKKALDNLFVENAEEIIAYIKENNTIEGANLSEDIIEIFDCAVPGNGKRFIDPKGHIKMMSAIQPFLSSAISKTVNVPENITKQEIKDLIYQSWKLGIKCVTFYRDGCKCSQPLSTNKESLPNLIAPIRKKLSSDCEAKRHKFRLGEHKGYIHVGLYEDNTPGELFVTMSKEGSTMAGLMDTIATLTSIALQYGVPLEDMIDKFKYTRFPPDGFTNNQDIPIATSLVDYVFRYLELLGKEKKEEIKKITISGPPCSKCGNIMVKAGTCYFCNICGETGGCS